MRASIQKTQVEQRQLEDRLRQAHTMEAVGRLAGGVAHDFNNLLTVIRGNSDLLLDRKDVDLSQRKHLDQIQKAADRAVSMTRQLLAFRRMQVLLPGVLDLNLIISEMNKMIPRLIGEHIEFGFLPEHQLSAVLADPGQMEQVILNLAINARDAMPDGGKITVRTKNVAMDAVEAAKRPPMLPGDYVLLSVSDNGHGMDAATKAHIFEPFFTTKPVGKGTGLGLATVYGIVKQSGGYIWVDSEPQRGTTSRIYLPEVQEAAPQPGAAVASVAGNGSETVLLVEDEAMVRTLARKALEAHGYRVLEAGAAPAPLELSERHVGPINLLLPDVVMRGMRGRELAPRLLQGRSTLRVLFMSGYTDDAVLRHGVLEEGMAYLQKPFTPDRLARKVREVLDGK